MTWLRTPLRAFLDFPVLDRPGLHPLDFGVDRGLELGRALARRDGADDPQQARARASPD